MIISSQNNEIENEKDTIYLIFKLFKLITIAF